MMKSFKSTILLCGAGLLLLLIAACAPAATPVPTAVPPSPTAILPPTIAPTSVSTSAPATAVPTSGIMPTTGAEVTDGSLFLLSCAPCHGQDGAGKTFEMDGNTITTPSLDWTDLSNMYSTDPSRGTVEEQFALAITKGLDETGDGLNSMMPRWSSLSQTQVDSLVQFIQTIGTTNGETTTLSPEAQDLMGEQLYQTSCAACHGQDGAGKTFDMDGNTITTPSLSWADLSDMYSTDPSRGTVGEQFALAITKGLDETGDDLNPMMPHWSFLLQAQVDSLVQYIQATFP